MGVSTIPGQSTLTRTPARGVLGTEGKAQPDDSVLGDRVRGDEDRGSNPAPEAVFTMWPDPWASITG